MSLEPGNAISIVIRRDEEVSEQYSFAVRTGASELDATTGDIHLLIGAFVDHGKTDNFELAIEEALKKGHKSRRKTADDGSSRATELQRRLDYLDEYIDSLGQEKNRNNSNDKEALAYQEKAKSYYSEGDLDRCSEGIYYAEFCISKGWEEVERSRALFELFRKRLIEGGVGRDRDI